MFSTTQVAFYNAKFTKCNPFPIKDKYMAFFHPADNLSRPTNQSPGYFTNPVKSEREEMTYLETGIPLSELTDMVQRGAIYGRSIKNGYQRAQADLMLSDKPFLEYRRVTVERRRKL